MEPPFASGGLGAARRTYAFRAALLVAANAVAWFVVPTVARSNVPLDVVEIVYWGREWCAGYFKHPPLPSWILETAARAFPGRDWPFYALSQAAVAVALWAVWRLGLTFGSARRAFYGVLLVLPCWFYGWVTPEFNHAVCMYPLWALAALALRRATTDGGLRHWFLFGLWTGAGALTKYNFGALAIAAAAYTLTDADRRRVWRTAGPWLAVSVAVALCVPHALWAAAADWPTVRYLADRTEPAGGGAARLTRPLAFLASQAVAYGPILLVAWPLLGLRPRLRTDAAVRARGAASFALHMALVPVAVYALLAATTGAKIRHPHGAPLWLLTGAALLAVCEPSHARGARRRFLRLAVFVAAGWAVAGAVRDVGGPLLTGRASRAHFPGRELAAAARERWRAVTDAPLAIVGGQWWFAGSVAVYDPERPSVYCGGPADYEIATPPALSPWTSDEDVRNRGALFVWDVDRYGEEFPAALRARFPEARPCPPATLHPRTLRPVPAVRAGFAAVPPRR